MFWKVIEIGFPMLPGFSHVPSFDLEIGLFEFSTIKCHPLKKYDATIGII